eukprot:TRINITY_DN1306_c0_g1_i2.p1 TRINITY_DN1306_c0_g1~~TRINITY_DN1306_c0_g1_i2.p1  ORF type:complete len:161 (-),score=23.97 TRINITY_DN1306_c0_g1_i2:603-1022(-)
MSSFTRNNNGTRSSSHRRPSYKNMATLERLIHLHRQEVDPENAAKIEKRVKNFIRSLDHHSAAQLSRTQLIKGHEKTVVWLKNSKDLAEPAVMTEVSLSHLTFSLFSHGILWPSNTGPRLVLTTGPSEPGYRPCKVPFS